MATHCAPSTAKQAFRAVGVLPNIYEKKKKLFGRPRQANNLKCRRLVRWP